MDADIVHTGFNDTGYLYCSKDQTVLEFSSFDPFFEKLVGPVHPWVLAQDGRVDDLRKVEDNLIPCPCGGRFSFDNPLICPVCQGVFSEPIAKNIHFIVLDRVIDGQKTNVWKCEGPVPCLRKN